MFYLPYNKDLRDFSRQLRNNSTLSEVLLWQELKAGSMKGYKFNRQKPLDRYIVDFYCKKLNLVIEIDGDSHTWDYQPVKDKERQHIIENMGLHFLRFDDLDVKKQMPYVLNSIVDFIEAFESKEFTNQSP